MRIPHVQSSCGHVLKTVRLPSSSSARSVESIAVRAAVEQKDPAQSTGDRHHQETRKAAPRAANEDDVKVIQLASQDRGAGTLSFEVIR